MTVKRVDPWSVLKLGLFLNLAGGAIILLTGVIVWSVVRRLQMVERGCEQIQNIFGLQECAVDGQVVFRGGFLMVALFVVVMTAVLVFSAFLYNLIADLTGGVEISAVDHTQGVASRGVGGGVVVAPELQDTRASPVVVGPSGRRDDRGSVPADAIDRRTREPSKLRKAAAVASSRLSEASKQATSTLTDATRTEATTRARRSEAATQSLDSVRRDGPPAKTSNGRSSSASRSDADRGGSSQAQPRRQGQDRAGTASRSSRTQGGSNDMNWPQNQD